MNRSRQVREIYEELRASVGIKVSPAELLAAAASLVALFDRGAEEPGFELRRGGLPFAQWAVDRMFADGGWRVLAMERHEGIEPDEDEMDRVDARRVLSEIEMGAMA
jgi:hypothetical protein